MASAELEAAAAPWAQAHGCELRLLGEPGGHMVAGAVMPRCCRGRAGGQGVRDDRGQHKPRCLGPSRLPYLPQAHRAELRRGAAADPAHIRAVLESCLLTGP